MPRYSILTDERLEAIAQLDRAHQADWLILSESPEFQGYWAVDAMWPDFYMDLESLIGRYRVVSPIQIDEFLEGAAAKGYHVAFDEDPTEILASYQSWNEPPPFALNSTLENTIQGFLPWQVVGFNRLIKDEALTAALMIYDTGAGKTAMAAAAIRWHIQYGHPFDLALLTVKFNNKTDTQRKLKRLGDIDSAIISGTQAQRQKVFKEIDSGLREGRQMVAITNYELIREDYAMFKALVSERRCLFFWDEAPTRLSNRSTQLYQRVKGTLYRKEKQPDGSFKSYPRPSWMRHWVMTATPVENSPEDVFNYVRLIKPGLLGSVPAFHDAHVVSSNYLSGKPERWRDLDKMEAKLNFMTHRVSKEDPDVAAFFPEVIPDFRLIDWNAKHRKVYDQLTGKAAQIVEDFSEANILALIQVMQMLCDAPSMILESARNRVRFESLLAAVGDLDEGYPLPKGPKGSELAVKLLKGINEGYLTDHDHTKLDVWREIILEKHPHDKIVTHSTWAGYIFPVWEAALQEWGVSYVLRAGTDKQKQDALDRFRTDPSIRVFLSGDSGSDSIDIPQAAVGVNYNTPWKWTTLKQREGRRDRVDSTFSTIYTYTLQMANSIEERKRVICERKRDYHAKLFEGKAMETSISAKLSRQELMYLLLG